MHNPIIFNSPCPSSVSICLAGNVNVPPINISIMKTFFILSKLIKNTLNEFIVCLYIWINKRLPLIKNYRFQALPTHFLLLSLLKQKQHKKEQRNDIIIHYTAWPKKENKLKHKRMYVYICQRASIQTENLFKRLFIYCTNNVKICHGPKPFYTKSTLNSPKLVREFFLLVFCVFLLYILSTRHGCGNGYIANGTEKTSSQRAIIYYSMVVP